MKIITNKSIIQYLKQFKVLIWDFDGVIVNSNDIRVNAFYYALNDFEKFRVDELLKYHRENGGLSRYAKFDWFFSRFSISINEEKRKIILKRFSDYCLSRISDRQILRDEVLDIIKFFYKENKIMYVASASSNDELNVAAKALKISHFFNGILGSPRNKIQSIKEIKNLNKKFSNLDFLLIGDALNDLDAARKNKINFLGYNNDFLSKEKIDYWR